jgi:hypothetical protein
MTPCDVSAGGGIVLAVGLLRRKGFDETFLLGSRCLIGRNATCDLRIDDARVSAEHAVIHHSGSGWELRDLGSLNGTFVNKRRVKGERVYLSLGSVFAVGGRDLKFELVDDSAPVASARHIKTGAVRTATNGLLVLPNEEYPAFTIFESPNGRWIAESPNASREVSHREVLIVDSEGWRLDLPVLAAGTLDVAARGPKLDAIALRFAVSRDEEHIEVVVIHQGIEKTLPTRNFHYLLLTLARAWIKDVHATPRDRGWVDRELLCRMLRSDATKLNMEIFRAREQLGDLNIHGAAGLVERRAGTGELRLGVDRVEVVKL